MPTNKTIASCDASDASWWLPCENVMWKILFKIMMNLRSKAKQNQRAESKRNSFIHFIIIVMFNIMNLIIIFSSLNNKHADIQQQQHTTGMIFISFILFLCQKLKNWKNFSIENTFPLQNNLPFKIISFEKHFKNLIIKKLIKFFTFKMVLFYHL